MHFVALRYIASFVAGRKASKSTGKRPFVKLSLCTPRLKRGNSVLRKRAIGTRKNLTIDAKAGSAEQQLETRSQELGYLQFAIGNHCQAQQLSDLERAFANQAQAVTKSVNS